MSPLGVSPGVVWAKVLDVEILSISSVFASYISLGYCIEIYFLKERPWVPILVWAARLFSLTCPIVDNFGYPLYITLVLGIDDIAVTSNKTKTRETPCSQVYFYFLPLKC